MKICIQAKILYPAIIVILTYTLDGLMDIFLSFSGCASVLGNQEVFTTTQEKSLMTWTKTKQFGKQAKIEDCFGTILSIWNILGLTRLFVFKFK